MINLNVKSTYSFFSSALSVDDIITLNNKSYSEFVAVNDVNSFFAYMELRSKCEEKKCLHLVECYLSLNDKVYVISLLANSKQGYLNLCALSKVVSKKDLVYLSLEDLKDYLTGNFLILNSKYLDEEILQSLKKLEINFVIGLLAYKDKKKIENVRALANKYALKVIPFNEVLMLQEQDELTLKALKAIENNSLLENINYTNEDYKYLLDKDSYLEIYNEEEINLLKRICNYVKFDLFDIKAPFIDYKVNHSNKLEYFKFLCHKGLERRLNGKINQEYLKRLEYEIEIINQMGYIDYFLVVQDYVKFAIKKGIMVGVGRGSSCSSLVSYCLGIVGIDPLKHGLVFERFLNPQRISMPDIDIDFQDERRGEVIDYLKEKYGNTNAVNIISFQTFGIKQALKDSMRILNFSTYDQDYFMRNVVIKNEEDLDELYASNKKFKEFIDSRSIYRQVFKIARKLTKKARQTSLHAAGVIVHHQDLTNFVPLYEYEEGKYAVQYDYHYVEKLGLLKMDILGLRNLSIILNCVNFVKLRYPNFDLNKINFEDEKVYRLLASGETIGLFQVESKGMQNALKLTKVNSFNDLTALIALYRPGPIDQIKIYADRKNNQVSFNYPHIDLEDILKETQGIIVYQEQIIQILQKISGFSLGKADVVRRDIAKKNLKSLEKSKEDFINGATKNGYSLSLAISLWDLILKFASYGFNKAHSVAYSYITYQMAYLKYYFPREFYATLLNNSYASKSTYLFEMIKSMSLRKISLERPLINLTQMFFYPLDKQIIFSLACIKGVNYNEASYIIKEREKGNYVDFIDFVLRVKNHVSKESIINLINAGAFDEFGYNRETYRFNLNDVMDYALLVEGLLDVNVVERLSLKNVNSLKQHDLILENDALGIILSPFPTFDFKVEITQFDKLNTMVNKKCYVYGIVLEEKVIKTKGNERMKVLKILNNNLIQEIVIFPKMFKEYENEKFLNNLYLMNISVGVYKDALSLNLNSFKKL